MHGSKLVKDLVDKALDVARENRARRVKKVSVKMGLDSHLTLEDFSHLFKVFSRATILESAEVSVSKTHESGLILESVDLEV